MGYWFDGEEFVFPAKADNADDLYAKFERFCEGREDEAERSDLALFGFSNCERTDGHRIFSAEQSGPVERIADTYKAFAEFVASVIPEKNRAVFTASDDGHGDDDGNIGDRVGFGIESGNVYDIVWRPFVGTSFGEVHLDEWAAGKDA